VARFYHFRTALFPLGGMAVSAFYALFFTKKAGLFFLLCQCLSGFRAKLALRDFYPRIQVFIL
jgi:hypothetical protein